MRRIKIIIYLSLLLAGGYIYTYFCGLETARLAAEAIEPMLLNHMEPKRERAEIIVIGEGTTYGELMKSAGVEYSLAMELYEAAKDKYDLIKIRQDREIELIFDKERDELKELRYKIDTEDELIVSRNSPGESATGTEIFWQAEVKAIPYEVVVKVAGGTVESSMYQAALDNNIDIRAIIEMANAFQWTIDFAMDPRQGDTFAFVYEERYLGGEYIMPGQVLAGRYVNDGTTYEVYFFEESDHNIGFFDPDGNSVQKMFLKAPVEFKYISSGFTTGLRYVEAFNVSTGHRAIDYAAPAGTPIRAVGDGTVISAGWNSSGYGNFTSVRHNGTYTTNYAHQSRIIVKRGQKVKQGQVIGYVGTTGFSTGPHLHYEMVKNGEKVNPLREVLPPGQPIKEEDKPRFMQVMAEFKVKLDSYLESQP